MSEELPGLAPLRAMLGASDNSQLIVRGMAIVVAVGTFYVVSTEALYGDAPPLPQSQVEANIAPIGTVALTAPPAPAVESAPVAEEARQLRKPLRSLKKLRAEEAPAVEEAAPVAEEAPAVEEAAPVAEEAPAVEETAPVAEEAPAVEEDRSGR
jgi:resuscitation-promoting factor RpfA